MGFTLYHQHFVDQTCIFSLIPRISSIHLDSSLQNSQASKPFLLPSEATLTRAQLTRQAQVVKYSNPTTLSIPALLSLQKPSLTLSFTLLTQRRSRNKQTNKHHSLTLSLISLFLQDAEGSFCPQEKLASLQRLPLRVVQHPQEHALTPPPKLNVRLSPNPLHPR